MVFSRGEVEEEPRRVQRHVDEEARLRREQLIQQTESDENRTEQFSNQLSSTFLEGGESNNKSRERSPFFPLESDENTIEAYKSPRSPKSFLDANAFTDETTSDTTADASNNH